MQLNHVRLNLPTQVTRTAVTTGNSLRIDAQLDSEVFQQIYKDKIANPGLSGKTASLWLNLPKFNWKKCDKSTKVWLTASTSWGSS